MNVAYIDVLGVKKMVQVVQIGGRVGVEVIWAKSKRTGTFFL